MPESVKPLFVRLPSVDSERLDAVAMATGKSKRHLVSEAVREHLSDDGLTVGRITLREESNEVLTLPEAAALLRVSDDQLEVAVHAEEVPARRIGTEWRFSRAALLAWLSCSGMT